MRRKYIDKLLSAGVISENKHNAILNWMFNRPFSLHWELRIILYAGILLLTTGLGIIIYQNIETIGHSVIILLIAIACVSCFYFSFRNKLPFSTEKVTNSSPFFDYVLLLGCLLFLAFESYLQYQYSFFGTRYGIAALIPALLFLFIAYYFDHVGVLAVGITCLASFAGITASPGILLGNQFYEAPLIFTYLGFALFLVALGYFLKKRLIKKHFTFTHYNFGFNMLLISLLSGSFTLGLPYLYFIILLVTCFLLARYAILEKSFYFLLVAVIYAYIGITWAVFKLDMLDVFGFYYFVVSCIGVIYFFINYKKILKIK